MSKPIMLKAEEFIDSELLNILYEKFKQHMANCETKQYFKDVIETILIKNSRMNENIHKILSNFGLKMEQSALIHFLEANCYSQCIPKMDIAGHEWTDNEQRFIMGYWLMVHNLGRENYPHTRPEDQVREIIENEIPQEMYKGHAEMAIDRLAYEYHEFHNTQVEFNNYMKKNKEKFNDKVDKSNVLQIK